MYTLRIATNRFDAIACEYETLREALDVIALESAFWTNGDLWHEGRQLLRWLKV